jgi:glycerol-3-phosphate dehydrogenase (NAD(P)+)
MVTQLNLNQYKGPIINTAKGMELKTFLTPSEILVELGCQNSSIYTLSGPSHAEEVAKNIPTSVVLAGEELPVLKNLLEAFSAPTFRPYYSHDRLGVELGGALKNIIAIAAGVALGLGYGMNTISAIITRGISEIKRYGEYRSTNKHTYNGLSCVGDLITTCCSEFSRNREYGRSLVDSKSTYQKLAEGALTVQSLIEQINSLDFDMPLCRAVYEIAINKRDPSQMMQKLISRPLKEED